MPTVKVKFFTENSGLLALEDRELGRVTIEPRCTQGMCIRVIVYEYVRVQPATGEPRALP